MKQVPIGVVGEIYIGGIQVGEGYIGKKELTSEKFLDNPFAPGKMYKSGDIGRWTFDGKIQCRKPEFRRGWWRVQNAGWIRLVQWRLSKIRRIISIIRHITICSLIFAA